MSDSMTSTAISSSATPSTTVSSGGPDAGPASGSNGQNAGSGKYALLEAGRVLIVLTLLIAVAGAMFAV